MKLYRKLNKVMASENHLKNGKRLKSLMNKGIVKRKLLAILIMMLSITHIFAQSDWGFTMGHDFAEVFPNGMPSSGGQFTITIVSTFDWTVSCSETWITASPVAASKNGTVTVTVAANTTTSERRGAVTFWTILEDGRDFLFCSFSFSVPADTVNPPTAIPPLLLETATYLVNGILYIQSPFVETVQVFSLSGMLISNFPKREGTAIYPVNQSKNTILIVKGSSGWTKKVIVQ